MMEIESSLETTLQYPDQVWSWGIHQLPVDYSDSSSRDRCEFSRLGSRILGFDEILGYLTLPGNESSKWQAPFPLTGCVLLIIKLLLC